jgi:serine/threonine protein kinase
MSTQPGESIGPYVIQRELGRGGMGVVYLARDDRLGREVAIKALPEHLSNDPDRLARFQREARVLASLNHPNIAGIHGLEEAGGQHFLVLELVEGESLDAVLDRGPMPVADAIETAVAIAQALEAAHDKGIVHRDLKPANIMLTAEGVPKVLDFGLARQSESFGSTTDVSPDSPTITAPPVHSPTIPGAIMGTAGYMSPEQARGRQVDKRSDIFSFGCVLFELLTGTKPFAGDTIADVLGATLHKELDLSLLPAETPSNVRRVLTRCLAKDKRNRLHDIADARIELQTPEPVGSVDRTRPVLIPGLIGACLLAIIAAAGAWVLKPVPPTSPANIAPPAVFDAEVLLPEGQRLGHGFHPGLAISDDGSMIAFPLLDEPFAEGEDGEISRRQWLTSRGIVVRRLDSSGLIPVAGTTEGSNQPTFSPDGRWIAYVDGSTNLMKVALAGGQPVRLAVMPQQIVGLDWSDDGWIYVGQYWAAGIQRVPEGGGQPEVVIQPDPDSAYDGIVSGFVLPCVVPGGGLVFTRIRAEFSSASLSMVNLATKEKTDLLEDAAHARFANDHLVFVREGNLFAAPLDPRTLTLTGTAKPLPESVVQCKYYGNITLMTQSGQFDLSPGGTIVLAEGSVPGEPMHKPVWVDIEGRETEIAIEPRSYLVARVMPDGERLIFSTYYGPTRTLWSYENARGIARRIVRPDGLWYAPGPGPDRVTFALDSDDELPSLVSIDLDAGLSSVQPVLSSVEAGTVVSEWSRDGARLVATRFVQPSDSRTLWKRDAEGVWSRVTNTAQVNELWPAISPDGRWIAFATFGNSNSREGTEVFVSPLATPGPVRQVSIGGGVEPRWSPDGTQIYYRGTNEQRGGRADRGVYSVAFSVSESDPDRVTLARPLKLFNTPATYVSVTPVSSWDVAPDGRFLFIKGESPDDQRAFFHEIFPDRLRVIQNWASRLGLAAVD